MRSLSSIPRAFSTVQNGASAFGECTLKRAVDLTKISEFLTSRHGITFEKTHQQSSNKNELPRSQKVVVGVEEAPTEPHSHIIDIQGMSLLFHEIPFANPSHIFNCAKRGFSVW